MNKPITREFMRKEIERLAGLVLECKMLERETDLTPQEIFFLDDNFRRVLKVIN